MAERDRSQGHAFVYSNPKREFNFNKDPQPTPKKLTMKDVLAQLDKLKARLDEVTALLEQVESGPDEHKRSHK